MLRAGSADRGQREMQKKAAPWRTRPASQPGNLANEKRLSVHLGWTVREREQKGPDSQPPAPLKMAAVKFWTKSFYLSGPQISHLL